ncbi:MULTISPECIES: ATP-binding protein [unclassified Nitrospina]|uniref:ATP-binding protein n=1 Tax=unclassified Nitrospina TaxID=2638683 RepID=UPI003F9B2162
MKKAEEIVHAKLSLLKIIDEFQLEISRGDDLHTVFRNLTRRVLGLTESEYGFIADVRESPAGDPYVSILAYCSISTDPEVNRFFQEYGRSGLEFFNLKTLFGQVFTTGNPVVSNDPANDPRGGGLPKGHPPLNAFVGLPVSHGGKVLGMLCLANCKDGYKEDLVEWFQPLLNVCGQVLLGLRNSRKDEEVERCMERKASYIHLLKSVTRIAAQSDSFESGLRAYLREICVTLDCALGVVHRVDDSGTCLVPAGIVYQNIPDLTLPTMSRVMEAVFANGEGLPGRVWDSGLPVWEQNVWRDTLFLKRLDIQESGAGHSGFAFPIPMNNDFLWVVQVYTSNVREPDMELLEILTTAGTQLQALLEHKQLSRSRAVLNTILRNAQDAIIEVDLDGKITGWNSGAERIFGYKQDELMDQNLAMLIAPGNEEDAGRILDGIRGGDTVKFETRGIDKNEETLELALTLAPVLDSGGACIGATVIAWDATGWKQRERELLRTRIEANAANRAKSEFLAHMSHEIHTPLNSVLGFAQIIERDPRLPPQHKEYVSRILDGGNQLMRLMDDILEMSKIDGGESELYSQAFDLVGMVDRINSSIRNRCMFKGLDYFAEGLEERPLWVYGDEAKLHMALTNILSNAIKFTDQGAVLLRVQQKPNEWFRFEIIDTGRGIAEDQLAKVFDPFEKLGEIGLSKGMGLGLSISKKHIEAMGGTITVQSAEGKGTHFTIELPLKRFGELSSYDNDSWHFKKPLAWMSLRAGFTNGFQLLESRQLGEVLESLGISLHHVENIESPQMLEDPGVDLVFLNLDGLGAKGEALIRNLRKYKTFEKILLVGIAGTQGRELADVFKQAGANQVLDKPVKAQEILQIIGTGYGLTIDFLKRTSGPQAAASDREIDLARVHFSNQVMENIKAAASSYNFTSFEKSLNTIQGDGEEKKLALYFKDLIRSYDMKLINQVIEFLNRIQSGPSS